MVTSTYPNMLAKGVTDEGTFLPFELYAGESDIVSSQGVAAGTIAQFAPVARNGDGQLVTWGGTEGRAGLVGTFSAVGTANDTITINGQVYTLKTAAASTYEVTIGATATLTAANLVAKINAHEETSGVTASNSGAVITLTAVEPGPGGNSIAVSEASTAFSWAGGATALTGGSDQTEALPVGIAAQPATAGVWFPFFIGGSFNHEAIAWPVGIASLADRQRVFDRTNIQIGKLLGSPNRMTLPG